MDDETQIVILAAALIANGRPYHRDANVEQLVKEAVKVRDQIRKQLEGAAEVVEFAQAPPRVGGPYDTHGAPMGPCGPEIINAEPQESINAG